MRNFFKRETGQLEFDIGYIRKNDSLNLFAWQDVENFGDKLGPALFNLLSGKPTHIEARGLQLTFNKGASRTIYCFLGTMAQLLSGPHHFIFWGFGSAPTSGPKHHGAKPMEKNLDLEVRAVRGPLTQKLLIEAGYAIPKDVPLGDPGLLAPYYFKRAEKTVSDFCIVPHHTQYEEWREKFHEHDVIDIRLHNYENLQDLITELTKYKAVFSSSLHVTILAESFGIPTISIEPRLKFKFDDFYASCHKKPIYIETISPGFDWSTLYQEALSTWKPIRWDPEAFLNAAPFEIDQDIQKYLSKHYKDLQLGKRNELSGGYVQNTPKRRVPRQQAVTRRMSLYSAKTKNEFEDWEIHDDSGISIHKLQNDGYHITDTDGFYLATPFVDLNEDIKQVDIDIDIDASGGSLEVRLQDANYETLDSVLIDSKQKVILQLWPLEEKSKLRLVFLPTAGNVTVNKLGVTGISMI